jgi:hypothetical protein
MKQTNQIPPNVWPLLAAPFFIALTACDRGEVSKLRAENEALKRRVSVVAPKENQESERAIIVALRKIGAAVNTGTNYQSYGDLLIQSVVEIEPRLPEISDGPFKESVVASLQAYKDARDFWSKFATSGEDIARFSEVEKAHYAPYKLQWLTEKEEVKPYGVWIKEPTSKRNLFLIWKEGERRAKLAESAAK